jgi:curved DNA-binding protein
MAKRDYYDVLGVKRDASEGQIKSAYRKLAKRYHPDRNKNDKTAEAKFKEIQQAYDVLSDTGSRQRYDQFGHAGVEAGPAGQAYWEAGPGGVRNRVYTSGPEGIDFDLRDLEGLFGGMGEGGVGSIFERFVRQRPPPRPRGRRAARRAPDRGEDIEHEVSLDFEDAIRGRTLEVTLPRTRSFGRSGGETIEVRIPPGVQPGQRVRVRGKGQSGRRGAPAGDMYIVCRIRPHQYFKRLGSDIYLDVPITVAEACLGAKIDMPTIDGPTVVTIPPGTASGTKLRLKGKGGMDAKTQQRGDHYAVVRIVPPKSLTERQDALLTELAESSSFDPRKDLGWDSTKL